MVSCIWIAITFVKSAKIILRPLGSPRSAELFLQLFSSAVILVSTGRNIRVGIEVKN